MDGMISRENGVDLQLDFGFGLTPFKTNCNR